LGVGGGGGHRRRPSAHENEKESQGEKEKERGATEIVGVPKSRRGIIPRTLPVRN